MTQDTSSGPAPVGSSPPGPAQPGPTGTAAPPPPPRPPLDLHRLRRSRTDRKVAGVCGGLGRWADIDPVVFRIVLVVMAVFGGLGLLVYGLLWLLVPEEGSAESEGQRLLSGHPDSGVIWPIILVLLGLGAAGGSWRWVGPGSSGLLLVIVLVVAVLLVQRSREPHATSRPGTPGAPGPTAPGSGAPASSAPGATGATGPERTGEAPAGGEQPGSTYAGAGAGGGEYGGGGYGGGGYGGPSYEAPPAPVPRERSALGGITVSVGLIVVGLLISWALLSDSRLGVHTVLSVALLVVALGLLVGTFYGRSRGLVVLGVLLSIGVLTSGVADVSVRGGVGERQWTPASVAAVTPYELSVGDARLDLTALDDTLPVPAPGQTVTVNAHLGIGNLTVRVPTDVRVEVRAHVGTGTVKLPDGQWGGFGVDRTAVLNPGAAANGTIVLKADVGIGDLEVQ